MNVHHIRPTITNQDPILLCYIIISNVQLSWIIFGKYNLWLPLSCAEHNSPCQLSSLVMLYIECALAVSYLLLLLSLLADRKSVV